MRENIKSLLKKIGVYHPLQSSYRSSLSAFRRIKFQIGYRKYKGTGFVCNYCGAVYSRFVPEYPDKDIREAIEGNAVIAGFGENVFCPNCLSKNRERLVKHVMESYIDFTGKKILHFSPEKNLHKHLSAHAHVTTIDLEPGFYKAIDSTIIQGDATRLQFADNSFDVVVANHILEHIPDDVKAMSEILRVLKKDGVAVLQVPLSTTLQTTIEDVTINDPKKQAALYGQKDHVRIYTLEDYTHRLRTAGFIVRVITPEELAKFRIHAIQENEPVVLGYKG